jgi:hypothetical protein
MSSPPPELSIERATAIVQATTVDIFNDRDQLSRRKLMEDYWSADITCYTPFGVSLGYDAMDQLWDGRHPFITSFTCRTYPEHAS